MLQILEAFVRQLAPVALLVVGLARLCAAVDPYLVTWDAPGIGHRDSMPIGNGDLGMNLWTEASGDVVLLIGKTDAWSENGQLLKLGRVRVAFTPSPFRAGASFRQVLRTRDGVIEIHGDGQAVLQAWVDADAPVIHVQLVDARPRAAHVSLESWRTAPRRLVDVTGNAELAQGLRELQGSPAGGPTIDPDTVLAAPDSLIWLHHNARSIYGDLLRNQHLEALQGAFSDPLLHRNVGALARGPGLTVVDDHTLTTATPQAGLRLDITAFANVAERTDVWRAGVQAAADQAAARDAAAARAATQAWWNRFWERSWILVGGEAHAAEVTQGFIMQRWMTACGGRGPAPIKFNGGTFTVGQEPPSGTPYVPEQGRVDPDFRVWGSNVWFQNTRLIYWPMIANGDLDTLAPFYAMYKAALPLATARTRLAWRHDGAIFPETIFFFGLPSNNDFGWGNPGPEMTNPYIGRHFNNAPELMMMLLDTWDLHHDADLATGTLLPLADAFTLWFDQHWPRVAGKLRFEPSEALETRQHAADPLPDIAGLMQVLTRLCALPEALTTPAQRARWHTMLADLPPLPRGLTDAAGKVPVTPDQASPTGTPILWPAASFDAPKNSENPELYAVHPYRLFGVGLPELELARATYEAKRFADSTCWGQQGIQAACLGFAARAQREAVANFTAYDSQRFRWFWKSGDWQPDLDNGGAGQLILQSMLMQARGDRILLFPAWPKAWDVDFRLHAAHDTVVSGTVRGGRVIDVTVIPESRRKDVVQMELQ